MSFISYAQNFEDVLLWRALGHVGHGFYIDVGANDPEQHSVTKAFYERGWHGINIEPLTQYHQAFRDQRPRDINLCMAAGAQEGSITLFDVPSVPGWASSDPAVAQAHREQGYEVVAHTVPLKTLRSICEQHVSHDIHFLKIDVEGFEAEVLRGMDFARWQPWVLAIEATLPNSRETNHESWEALVTGPGYRFAYFDGLNRYYVAPGHDELLSALQVQANVFDDFISVHLARAWQDAEAARALVASADARAHAANAQRADAAQARAMEALLKLVDSEERRHAAETRASQLDARISQLDARISQLEFDLATAAASGREAAAWASDLSAQMTRIQASLTWRLLGPLRWLGRRYAGSRRASVTPRLRAALIAALRSLAASARVRALLRRCLRCFPALEARMMRLAGRIRIHQRALETASDAPDAPALPARLANLPPSARCALADLERARQRSSHS